MGYVEVGGNGSVVWHAQHDRGSNGEGHSKGAWGHDELPPKGSGALFTLLVNGEPVPGLPPLPVDNTKISVLWGEHGPGNPTPDTSAVGVAMDKEKVRGYFGRLVATSTPGGGPSGGKGGKSSDA